MKQEIGEDCMYSIEEEVSICTLCRLHEGRVNPVLGEGNIQSPIVFVGEGPGRKEDEAGRPFVGAAGKLLSKFLLGINLKREDVYIANIVKCRPPKNRKPKVDEVLVCTPYLDRQLSLIKPRIIAPMGNSAVAYFSTRFHLLKAPIGDIHGSPYTIETEWGNTIIFPLYHPAAVLYNRSLEVDLENDFNKIKKLLENVSR